MDHDRESNNNLSKPYHPKTINKKTNKKSSNFPGNNSAPTIFSDGFFHQWFLLCTVDPRQRRIHVHVFPCLIPVMSNNQIESLVPVVLAKAWVKSRRSQARRSRWIRGRVPYSLIKRHKTESIHPDGVQVPHVWSKQRCHFESWCSILRHGEAHTPFQGEHNYVIRFVWTQLVQQLQHVGYLIYYQSIKTRRYFP